MTELSAPLAEKLARMGITELNDIQRRVLATDKNTESIVLIAPTGSGKTVAYALALLRNMKPSTPGRAPQALVLAPARELARQIFDVLRPLAAPELKTVVLSGGRSVDSEIPSLTASTPPDIIVATPGRFLDHISRGSILPANIRRIVIDEYDKLLELGFERQLSEILQRISKHRSLTMLTSATTPESLPKALEAEGGGTPPVTIDGNAASKLIVMDVPAAQRDKLDTLAVLVRELLAAGQTSMVFVNHRDAAERVVSGLGRRGVTAVLYHGGLEQRQREIAVAAFVSHAADVMVSTDLGARGLDIPGVGAVIHYHLPVDEAAYTHRNGRTARAGADGTAYVILGPSENMPPYINTDHTHYPAEPSDGVTMREPYTLMYIDGGRRRKISRGDILGFAVKDAGIPGDKVGHISIAPDYALVAVAAEYASALRQAARLHRLKGQKVRITPI